MTRRWHSHRLFQVLPADRLLTPSTCDQQIALTPVLVLRLELAGLLAQTAALLPDTFSARQPEGIPLPQLVAMHQLGTAQRSRGVRLHGLHPHNVWMLLKLSKDLIAQGIGDLALSRAAAGPHGSSEGRAVRRHTAEAGGEGVRAVQRSLPLLQTGTVKPEMLVKGRIALDRVATASTFFPLALLIARHHASSPGAIIAPGVCRSNAFVVEYQRRFTHEKYETAWCQGTHGRQYFSL